MLRLNSLYTEQCMIICLKGVFLGATEKTIATASKLIKDGSVSTIFAPSEEELNEAVKKIVDNNKIEVSYLHTLSNITTDERKNKDYVFTSI